MESNILAEKLAFQVESFREGFDVLSKSRDFKEMTKMFAHLLRGNFPLMDIFLLYRKTSGSEWEAAGFGNTPDVPTASFLENPDTFRISFYPDKKIAVAVILPLIDSAALGVLIGEKTAGNAFSDLDKIVLQILLQVFDGAHKSFISRQTENKLIFDLNEKVFQLNNLIDTGIELSKQKNKNILYRLALERASSLTNASSALIKITQGQKGSSPEFYTFPPELNPESILKNKLKIESVFNFRDIIYEITLSQKEIRGGATQFTELDKILLEAVTRQLSASIENEFLNQQSLEKERIEKELSLASSIQQRIIPDKLPEIKGYDLAGTNIPSREVGGDYYDCIKLKNGKYAFIVADVAGKGIAAALLVNTLNAALYSYFEFDLSITEIAEKLNVLIFKTTPPDKYITFFIALLEPLTGNLEMVNAGHNPILLLRKKGTLEQIAAGGLGLGMLDLGLPYQGENFILNSGDSLFLYTDGIPEAMNDSENEYSEERMIKFLMNYSIKPANEFTSALIEDVRNFTSGTDQSDDITLLLLKKL